MKKQKCLAELVITYIDIPQNVASQHHFKDLQGAQTCICDLRNGILPCVGLTKNKWDQEYTIQGIQGTVCTETVAWEVYMYM